MPVLDLAGPFAQGVSTPHADGDFWMLAKMNQLRRVLRRATAPTLQRVVTLVVCDPWVTSRCVVEFLGAVRVSGCDYAAVSSGMVTSSGAASRSFIEVSLK